MVRYIDILGNKILDCDYDDMLKLIDKALNDEKKLLISYANANTINLAYKDLKFKKLLNENFLIHPDGIGVYLASWLLNKSTKLKARFSGSDFYPILARYCINKNINIYFFGHDISTLNKISTAFHGLQVCSICEGYNYNSETVIADINNYTPGILIAGLGQPLQEKWIVENKDTLRCKVILAVGDGIKVFAGEKKRGPEFMQKMGFEWLVRLLLNPVKLWKRYVLGNPIFLYRIIKAKLIKLRS